MSRPAAPPADAASLAVIGDLHGAFGLLEGVVDHLAGLQLAGERLDGILMVGDLASHFWERTGADRRRFLEEVARAIATVERLALPILFVPGNHDLPEVPDPRNADRRRLEMAGLSVVGLGGAGPARFGFPYEWGEDEILALDLPDADVLLFHTPPIATALDRVARGFHVGSAAVRRLAERGRGALVCGHIHEAAGVERVGDRLCLNAGSLGLPYPRLQVGFVHRRPGSWEVVHRDLEGGGEQCLEMSD